MGIFPAVQADSANAAPASTKLPFYRVLWVQVLVAIALAVVLGYVDPARAIAMKPLGDAFIRVISMIISLIIFCTVVTGIAGGDKVITNGGIYGTIVGLDPDAVQLRVADQVKMKIARSAIAGLQAEAPKEN